MGAGPIRVSHRDDENGPGEAGRERSIPSTSLCPTKITGAEGSCAC